MNAWTPFKIIEEVTRSWEFAAEQENGRVLITADTSTDAVDWESGTDLRVECMQCFESFALPQGAEVDFE